MAQRRWLLAVLSVASLLILAYGGVLLSFSSGVTERMEAESRLPGEDMPARGARALVLPHRGDPAAIPTFNDSGPALLFGQPGALLLVAEEVPDFPAGVDNASLVRAMAWVPEGTSNLTVTLRNVTYREGDNLSIDNLTVDAGALSGGRAGFLVKGDASREVRFAPAGHVVGTVEGFETLGHLVTILILGATGFVVPLVVIVATHRPSGRPGLGEVICAECRGPMPAASDFCPRCGAWKKGKDA